MLNSSINSASYSNMKSDLYRTISDALRGNDTQLEDIKNILIDIRDLLIKDQTDNNE